jgi:hypothetical protein
VALKHRQNIDRCSMQAVYDPVVADDYFADVITLKLGHDAAGTRLAGSGTRP